MYVRQRQWSGSVLCVSSWHRWQLVSSKDGQRNLNSGLPMSNEAFTHSILDSVVTGQPRVLVDQAQPGLVHPFVVRHPSSFPAAPQRPSLQPYRREASHLNLRLCVKCAVMTRLPDELGMILLRRWFIAAFNLSSS